MILVVQRVLNRIDLALRNAVISIPASHLIYILWYNFKETLVVIDCAVRVALKVYNINFKIVFCVFLPAVPLAAVWKIEDGVANRRFYWYPVTGCCVHWKNHISGIQSTIRFKSILLDS